MAINLGRHDYTSVDVIIKDRFVKTCTMAKDNSAIIVDIWIEHDSKGNSIIEKVEYFFYEGDDDAYSHRAYLWEGKVNSLKKYFSLEQEIYNLFFEKYPIFFNENERWGGIRTILDNIRPYVR